MYYINTQKYLRSRLGLASGLASGRLGLASGRLGSVLGPLGTRWAGKKVFFPTREMIVVHALQKERSQSVEG